MNTSIVNTSHLNITQDGIRQRTMTSFDQNYSIYIDDIENKSNKINMQNQNEDLLMKWLNKTQNVTKKYVSLQQADPSKPNSFYLIKIEQITDILYKKISTQQKHSKSEIIQNEGNVYLQINANLILNQKSKSNKGQQIIVGSSYSKRTLNLGVFQLEYHKNNFMLDEQLPIYFYSRSSSTFLPIIQFDLILYESTFHKQVEIMHSKKYLGQCEFDPTTGTKSKQKLSIHSYKNDPNNLGFLNYTVIMSDMFKPLQNLIPPNCLCSSNESIAGLAGRRLPKHINTFSSQLDYTQLFNFKLDLFAVFIPDILLKQKSKQAEQCIIMQFYGQNNFKSYKAEQKEQVGSSGKKNQEISTTIKEVIMQINFHNGWKIVNQNHLKLKSKMKVQKKNLKNKSSKNVQMISLHHYITQEIGTLPFVFIDQETALILQIKVKFQVKVKKQGQKQNSHTLTFPICHSISSLDKIISNQKQIKPLLKGSYLDAITSNIVFIPQANIQFYTKLTEINRNQVSNLSIKQHTNVSLVVGNKSQVQFEKINLQKQRMIRQNKKIKQQNRAKKIQLNQEIPLLDTTAYKQQLYRDEVQKMRQQRKDLEQVLGYLKQKVRQVQISKRYQMINKIDQEQSQQQEFIKAPVNLKNYYNSMFYKAALQNQNKNRVNRHFEQNTYEISNAFGDRNHLQCLYSGTVPQSIIRTQILQQNYAYGFFINCLNLLPILGDECLPRKFYFVFNFYKSPIIQSELCSLNPSTGQIILSQVYDEKQKVKKQNEKQLIQKKVIYFETGPNNLIHNDSQLFLEFINYLYYSAIEIKIYDYFSNIQFGRCLLRLREFIRMRRNQVSLKKDLYITKNKCNKAILRLQARSIRKDAKPAKLPSKLKQNIPNKQQRHSAQSRQLARIKKYKQSKNIDTTNVAASRIQKIINEQFTKEQIYINITRMRAQIIRLEVINRKNYLQSYMINTNDSDKSVLNNEQLIVVNQSIYERIKSTKWWQYAHSLYSNKNSNILIVNESNCFELEPGQKATLLLYFYSQRKFYEENQKLDQISEISNKIFCIPRIIDITLTNSQTGQLISIYKLHVNPQPEFSTFHHEIVRKNDSKVFIQVELPTQNPQKNRDQDFMIYFNDPTILVSYDQDKTKAIFQCYAGALNQCKQIQASIFSPFPQNKLLITYGFNIWGAQQIIIQNKLWIPMQFLLQIHNSICLTRGYPYICIFSQDEKSVNIKSKNPFKINSKQSKTLVRAIATPQQLGTNYYSILITPPLTLQGPKKQIIHRYIIKIITQEPDIRQKLTLRIKLTDKILEQPFNYTNSLSKKLKFKIFSTMKNILWSNVDEIEVGPRSEKKIKVKINAQMLNSSKKVILSFVSQKQIDHFQFNLELDNLF